ncbi:MAG: hypothetical protein WA294_20500 [Acidobacteriaceae bacterium]
MKLRAKLVCITETSLGQSILDREFWQKLEKPLGWRLASFAGQQSSDFYTMRTSEGFWTGLSVVTPMMRDSLLIAFGQEDVVMAERRAAQAAQAATVPAAPIVPFPRSRT